MSEAHQVPQNDYEQESDEVMAWFSRYDDLVAAGELEAMADMAAFPINEVTDDADGFGVVGPCDRDRFLAQMREVIGGAGEVEMESKRRPVFLSRGHPHRPRDPVPRTGHQKGALQHHPTPRRHRLRHPEDEHRGRGPAIRKQRREGLSAARTHLIATRRQLRQTDPEPPSQDEDI